MTFHGKEISSEKNSEIFTLFCTSITHLKYFKQTLEFLNLSIKGDLDLIHEKFDKEYTEVIKNTPLIPYTYEDIKYGTEEDHMNWDEIESNINFVYEDIISIHNNMNKIIIEAIIIKINSIIEKFFIKLSWIIYQAIIENSTLEIFPPDYKKVLHFTDSIAAINRILDYTKINIKASTYWESIKMMRNLRHILAHGNSIFLLENKDFENYEKVFGSSLLNKLENIEGKSKCEISNNFTATLDFNNNLIKFMEEYIYKFCSEPISF